MLSRASFFTLAVGGALGVSDMVPTWSTKFPADRVGGSPLVQAANMMFLTVHDDKPGTSIVAVNTLNGAIEWTSKELGSGSANSLQIEADASTLVVSSESVYALDTQDGSIEWTSLNFAAGEVVTIVPGTTLLNRLYLSSHATGVAALDFEDGSVVWKTGPMGGAGAVVSTPVLCPYISSSSAPPFVVATFEPPTGTTTAQATMINATDGSILWTVDLNRTGCQVTGMANDCGSRIVCSGPQPSFLSVSIKGNVYSVVELPNGNPKPVDYTVVGDDGTRAYLLQRPRDKQTAGGESHDEEANETAVPAYHLQAVSKNALEWSRSNTRNALLGPTSVFDLRESSVAAVDKRFGTVQWIAHEPRVDLDPANSFRVNVPETMFYFTDHDNKSLSSLHVVSASNGTQLAELHGIANATVGRHLYVWDFHNTLFAYPFPLTAM